MSLNCLGDRALISRRRITRNFLWALLLSFLYVCWLTGCGDTNNATTAPPPDTGPGPLTITTTSLRDGTVDKAYTDTLGASGGITPYTWSIAPLRPLPPDLTFSPTTGAITGTPKRQGTTSHTFIVQDSSSPVQTKEQTLFLTIDAAQIPLKITNSELPTGIVNAQYSSTTLQATGGTPPLNWDQVVQPALPNGLTWHADTHTIDGTPLNGSQGTKGHTFTVRDSANPASTATKTLSLTIVSLDITTTSADLLPDGTVSVRYSRTLVAAGGTKPLKWSFSGALPTGVTLNPDTGEISGTPFAAGTFNFMPQVTDAKLLTDLTPPDLSITIKKQ